MSPTVEERDAMLKEFQAVLLGAPNLRVFSIQLDPIEVENKRLGDRFVVEGLGCMCMDDTCNEGKWPVRAFYGMNSPSNPFDCWFMQKQDSGWRVLPMQD